MESAYELTALLERREEEIVWGRPEFAPLFKKFCWFIPQLSHKYVKGHQCRVVDVRAAFDGAFPFEWDVYAQQVVRPLCEQLFQGHSLLLTPGQKDTRITSAESVVEFLKMMQVANVRVVKETVGGVLGQLVDGDEVGLSKTRFCTTFVVELIEDYLQARLRAAYPEAGQKDQEFLKNIMIQMDSRNFDEARRIFDEQVGQLSEAEGQVGASSEVTVDAVVEHIQDKLFTLQEAVTEFLGQGGRRVKIKGVAEARIRRTSDAVTDERSIAPGVGGVPLNFGLVVGPAK